MLFKQIVLSFLTVFVLFSAQGASIDKAFKALQQFNYFEAKKLFEKSAKSQPSAACYGLAVIYSRTDNPFHQLDSAYVFINRSEASYSGMKEKQKVALKKYNFDYLQIVALRSEISKAFFDLELKRLDELSLDAYQKKHPWATEKDLAIALRDSLGFEKAKTVNTANAYNDFLSKYPSSTWFDQAKAEFYRLQYREQTTANTLVSYMNFEKGFPINPYVTDAQDQIYRISTVKNTVADLAAFIKTFPKNRNVPNAWRKLYQLYMADYSSERLKKFQSDYPDYPFMEELKRDQVLSEEIIIPYKTEGQFGWMNLAGEIVIQAQYNSVGFFKEGLAWAEKNGKYGYVNKANEVLIPFQFSSANDFENGRAVIEVNELYGIIDRSGTYIIPAQFKDLGSFTEGLIYAQKDSLYGYYDGFGFQRIQPQYDEAFSFSKGIAKVTFKEMDGFIDTYGSFIIRPLHESVQFFSDSILQFEEGDFVRFMNLKGDEIPNLNADAVGKLINDRAVYVYDGKVGYLDSKAKLIVPLLFDDFTNVESEVAFVGNYAKAIKAGKFGIIDKNGKAIVPFQYAKLGAVGALIAFEKAGKWGFIDLTNKIVLPATYEYAESFSDGLGIVQMLTLKGAINSKGQIIIPLEHTTIKKLDKNHYLVSRGAKYGIYNDKGKLVVPLEYGQIRKVQDDFYLLTKGQEMHFLQISTDRLITPVGIENPE